MGVRVSVESKSRLPAIQRAIGNSIQDIVDDTADMVKDFAQASMLEPKSGRLYFSHGRMHQASAPGQAPAVDVGTLMTSIAVDHAGPNDAYATTNNPYAEFLEYGTTRGLLPRPFMRPAAHKAAAVTNKIAGIKVKAAVSRAPW